MMTEIAYDGAIHNIFANHAKEYDSWYLKHPTIYESEVRLLKEFDLKGLGLEIGVGTGVFASRIGTLIGIDPAFTMLSIAKERGIEAIQAIGERLPFADKIFDYVLMISTLCFLDKPSLVIKESLRVLRKHGNLIICLILKDSSWGKYYEKKKNIGHKFYNHAKFYDSRELKKLIINQGVSIVEVISTLRYPPSEKERFEEPLRGYKGSFMCLRLKKLRYI